MDPQDERRLHARRPCDVTMDASRAGREFRCRALNASEGGLMVESPTPLAVAQRLTLRLRGVDRSRLVDAEAEVVWAAPHGNSFRAGVRFLRRHEEFIV